ncbi:TetR/AcrR family transcriptional regulator [Aquihabitans sp. McL0605]|uniref:TetR/AcrR family transcriptional regulator n=1 Tax=Aquihabitans sp. McL0605 TaxID=3415671 RepID=UPI003CE8CA42
MTVDAPGRLPRGRHGLSRDEVRRSQRDRLMLALAEAMAEQGYVGTSVADVITRAGVSRETFYQQFDSKLDCFLAAFDAAADLLFAPLTGPLGPVAGTDPPLGDAARLARFDELLGTYLAGLAAQPAFARLFLVEVYAAGPEAIARRVALQATIADAIAALLDVTTEPGRFACQALVAATSALVTAPLVAGDLDALPALRAPLVDLLARSALR